MYFCRNCGMTFTNHRHKTEAHGLDSPPYEELSVCPWCGDTDFDKTYQCNICGEFISSNYIRLSTGERICQECYTKENI